MRNLSAIALLVLMLIGFGMSVYSHPPLKGFTEKAYNEALPVYAYARNGWGRVEYALFGEGRSGVVVGSAGWLYTAEEFTCPHGWQQQLEQNLAYIRNVRAQMAQAGVALRPLIIPAKARVHGSHPLPGCRTGLYRIAREVAGDQADLRTLMHNSAAPGYMHTDTHWSPTGARLAAKALAQDMPALERQRFTATPLGSVQHKGDLTRYLPGVALAPELVEQRRVEGSAGLLDEAVPQVVLVGTSYSANSLWGFADALRLELQADVLNVADPGEGPFRVMQRYLESAAWRETPPKVLIWEIPERYLVLSP